MKKVEFRKFDKLEYTRHEQFNSLSVNLDFCGDNIKTIAVTSARENEGKSFVAMHLWRACAANGKRAVLVDCDLRKSQITRDYRAFSEEPIVGLTHYLAGMVELEEVIYSTNIENADIILAGKAVSNPMTLLTQDKFNILLDTLKEAYDVVIVDTPPVNLVIDSAYVAAKCDGTVLVIHYGDTSMYEILETKNQLAAMQVTILGTVLNRVPFNAGRYYYNASRYSYKYYKAYSRYGQYGEYRFYGNKSAE